jgi:UDP-2,4-diacetamido-2,4,6-trideoxy-beta-L-altropyranose hydrolase
VTAPVARPGASRTVVFRTDGGAEIGAGHVARCLPLADAFAALGWRVRFAGTYDGLAAWLLARADAVAGPPDPGVPCGVDWGKCDAAVVDSYDIAEQEICRLADSVPLATIAEARRCPDRGVLLDYHLDRSEPPSARLLAGPSFAPLDPAFARTGNPGRELARVLLTMGGSAAARELLASIAPAVNAALPNAELVLAGGSGRVTEPAGAKIAYLPAPSTLVEALSDIDMAITAAGLTAYELACAGIPQVAIAITANQHRVIRGLRDQRLALCLDITGGEALDDLPALLRRMRDPGLRTELGAHGMSVFDGHGAERAARALTDLFLPDDGWGCATPAGA